MTGSSRFHAKPRFHDDAEAPSAQTERWGEALAGEKLLGGNDSPVAFFGYLISIANP
jgi:hypothetical protein